MSTKEPVDRWITTILLSALSAVLWYLLLETRTDVATLRNTVVENASRVTTLEAQIKNISEDVRYLNEVQRKH